MLAEFPVEAGLPPGFEVLDDIQATIDFGQRWARFLDRVYDDPAFHRALTVVGALGFRMPRLAVLARLVHADWDRLADRHAETTPVPPPVPTLDPAAALAALDAAAALASECRNESDKLLRHITDVVVPFRDAAARRARRGRRTRRAGRAADAHVPATGQQRNWPDKPAVQAALLAADDAVEAAIDTLVAPAIGGLLDAVTANVCESVEDRRRAGRLEFHDLLVLARDLVRDDPSVRAALHDRYRHLLLDEFQDTDPLQIELAVLIATDDAAAGTKPWSECSVPPGRLFVVGDPKQSIYRFRRADIELYHEVRDLFGERLTLNTNFRSRPERHRVRQPRVRPACSTPAPPGLQAAYDGLLASRAPDGPSITVVGGGQSKDTDLARLRRQEAHELAALIRRVRDEEWPVARRGPDGTEVTGPARYADVAVLLPTRATLPYLEQALEDAGVPARIESQSLVYATAEVQELLAILTTIDDPADEVALVAALRAPAFACRDDRLLEFRQAGGRWDYRAAPPPTLAPTHPVVAAMEALRDLHEHRWWDTVSETVERVIRERRLMELAVARARPRDHWRRIRFVADAARAFADGGGTSLRGFVAWLAQQVDEEARAVEVVVPEPDDDAVRILTVHGAKGLEFPVVVLAGLGVGDRAQVPPVLWTADGTPEFQIGPRARSGATFRYLSAGYAARADHEKHATLAEQVRLLYVAATRARDHLVVSLYHRVNDTSHASRMLEPVHAVPDLWLAAPPFEPRAREAVPPPDPEPADADDGRRWSEQRARRIATGAAPSGGRGHRPRPRRRGVRQRRRPTTTSTRGKPKASDPRSAGAGAAPRSDAPSTPCSRPSTSPPARASRPEPGPRRWPKASPTAKPRSSTSPPPRCGPRWCATRSSTGVRTGGRCRSPPPSTACSSRASSTSWWRRPPAWWSSTTRPTRSPPPPTSTRRSTATRCRAAPTRSRSRPRSTARSPGACSCSPAAPSRSSARSPTSPRPSPGPGQPWPRPPQSRAVLSSVA